MSRSLKHIFFRRLTVLAILSALLLGVLLVRAQRAILLSDLANKGEAIARMLSAVTLDAVMVHDYATVERYVADIGDDPTIVSLSIRRADGELLASYEAAARPEHVLPVSHPITIGDERFGEVLIVFSTARVRDISRNLLLATVAAVILFHFLGVAISSLALKKAVTAPLARLNHAIRTLRQGDLHQRIDIAEPVELAEIGASFNDMTATIRESFAKINRQRQDLQFEQAKLAAIVDNMADGLFVTDNDGVIIAFNHSAEAISGFTADEALGRKCIDLYRTNLCRDACALHHAGETIRNRETTMQTRDDRLLQVTVSSALLFDARGEAVGGVQTFRDITADKKRHEMYCHTEKLAAIGQLAAGVAHEINNPLGNIIGYARYIRPDSPGEEIERKTAVIVEQARKCSDIVQGLLHFSRSAGAEPGPFDLNELIRRTIDLARYQAARQMTKLTFTGQGALTAFADPKKIEQVAFNLLNNALQAVKNQGHIRIESGRVGSNVYFSVADDGPGIDEALLPRIFDPFFTTKPVGEGTGLGLSICAGIVAEAGGSIDVEPIAGGGTRFTIILPASGTKKEIP